MAKTNDRLFDYEGIIELAKNFHNKANRFIEWFTYNDDSIDGKSKSKAYALFDSSLLDNIEVGTVKGHNRYTVICLMVYLLVGTSVRPQMPS